MVHNQEARQGPKARKTWQDGLRLCSTASNPSKLFSGAPPLPAQARQPPREFRPEFLGPPRGQQEFAPPKGFFPGGSFRPGDFPPLNRLPIGPHRQQQQQPGGQLFLDNPNRVLHAFAVRCVHRDRSIHIERVCVCQPSTASTQYSDEQQQSLS